MGISFGHLGLLVLTATDELWMLFGLGAALVAVGVVGIRRGR